MSLDNRVISPRRSAPTPGRDLSPSPSLVRLLGSVGFSAVGLGTFALSARLFGIDTAAWSAPNWSGALVLLFVASLVAALLGGLLGFMVGGVIKVRSDRLDYGITVAWHYLANGNIIWVLLTGLVMTKFYDREGAKELFAATGTWQMSVYMLGICSAGCLLISAMLLLAGLVKEGSKPRLAPCLALSLPITLAMWYAQFYLLRIKSWDWVIVGLVFPAVLILVAAAMINRDREQRRQFIKR